MTQFRKTSWWGRTGRVHGSRGVVRISHIWAEQKREKRMVELYSPWDTATHIPGGSLSLSLTCQETHSEINQKCASCLADNENELWHVVRALWKECRRHNGAYVIFFPSHMHLTMGFTEERNV